MEHRHPNGHHSGYFLFFKLIRNYSTPISSIGEKPVLFVPIFFRELLGFLLNYRKQRPEGLKQFASLNAKSLTE